MAIKWGDLFNIQIWRDFTLERLQEHDNLLPMFSMIPMTSGLKVSNPRGYIYGILGISGYGAPNWEIRVDYSRSVEDLNIEFPSHWIDCAIECSFIGFELMDRRLCLGGIGYYRQSTTLPSWVLDLSVLRTADINRVELERHQAAGKSALHMAGPDIRGAVLHLRGDIVATVTDSWLFDTTSSI